MDRPVGGGDRGVTPVIGIILVVAIVVILASVVGIYALNFGQGAPEPAPNVRFDAFYDERTSGNGQYLNVTVQAGERVPTDTLAFRVSGATKEGSTDEATLTGSPIDRAGDELITRDTISIDATAFDKNPVDLSDARVDLVWDPDPESGERGQTHPIWTWEDE